MSRTAASGLLLGLFVTILLIPAGMSAKEDAPAPQFTIPRVSSAPVIDGKDADACWDDAPLMTGFFANDYQGTPAPKQTHVRMTYDDRCLYVYIRCDEPQPTRLLAKHTENDQAIWEDDCVEIFISPEPSTTLHWIVNSNGAIFDERIVADDQSDSGHVKERSWNSDARAKSIVGDDYWATEIAIKLDSITNKPPTGTWKINFNRENHVDNVLSTFSRLIANFYQPKRFSDLKFTDTGAILTRMMHTDRINALVIHRSNPLFEELLGDEPGEYTAYMWDTALNDDNRERFKFTEEQWKQELLDMIRLKNESGISGQALPWGVRKMFFHETEAQCMEDFEKYGLKRKLYVESSATLHRAQQAGAEPVYPDPARKYLKARVSPVDPIYIETAVEELVKSVTRFKDKPYLGTVEGQDEPSIRRVFGKLEDMGPKMKAWYEHVRTEYGFGKYSIPAPDDPWYAGRAEEHPFHQIAFARWYSDAYADATRQKYEALKKIAPDVQYLGCNFWTMSGFLPYDFSVFTRYSDWISGDPYASSAERREGRGIYNHGFGTKLLRDLGGKPTITVVQAFRYAGYTPTPHDLREWVSQSLKTGASRIEYFSRRIRWTNRPLYDELLRISGIFTKMNRVNIPDDPDTAILVSLDSEAAYHSGRTGDHIYTAYSILGERLGTWFKFVSERQIERGEVDLSIYKVIYLPLGKYFPKEATGPVVNYVKNGGTLVIGDPEAFAFHRDGSSQAKYREQLVGARLEGQTSDEDTITMTAGKLKGRSYPIKKANSVYDHIHVAHRVALSPKAKVLATFPSGQPAVIEHAFGKGKVIYFTANPFAPDVVLIDSRIKELFREIQQQAGTKLDRPIWRFLLPKG